MNKCWIISLLLTVGILFSCKDRTSKNIRIEKKYQADESYLQHSIATDDEIDTYKLTCNNEGYEKAGQLFKNPIPKTPEQLSFGKLLFDGHCAHCHGKSGNADAPMILKNKYPPPPPYRIRFRTINEGKMFASISCGKNYMPGFKKELSPTERWQVILYIKTLVK